MGSMIEVSNLGKLSCMLLFEEYGRKVTIESSKICLKTAVR